MGYGNWRVTKAEFTTEEPYTMTVSFSNPHDTRETLTSTIPANTWHSASVNAWQLQEEKKLTAEMGSRLNAALEEIDRLNRKLYSDRVIMGKCPECGLSKEEAQAA